MPLILTNHQISTLLHTLTPSEFSLLTTSLSQALTTLSTTPSAIQQPQRTALTANGETTLFMPSSYDSTTAIKTVTLSASHPPRGTISISSSSGELQAILNAEEITGFRTALASTLLLPPSVKTAAIFGTGKQAEWALRLLLRAGVAATVVGRGTREEVARKLPGELKFAAIGRAERGAEAEVERLLAGVDAVFGCTPSEKPLFPAAWLPAERKLYVSLIGSYKPHMLEVEPALLRRAGTTVVVDSIEACLVEAGELIQGGFKGEELVEIGTVLARGGKVEGEGNVVSKCVGLGVMDLVVGRGIMKIAEKRKLGVKVEGFDE